MSRTLNEVRLVGNVVADPAYSSGQGTPVAHLTLATHRGEGDKRVTEYHRCTLWGRRAILVRDHVKKGDQLHVAGRLEYGIRDGERTVDVIVEEVVLGQRAQP